MAADLPSEIRLALFEAEVYGRSIVVPPLASRAKFAWRSASSFPGMPECPGTTNVIVVSRSAKLAFVTLKFPAFPGISYEEGTLDCN